MDHTRIKIWKWFNMYKFLTISRHSPENCPMHNEKARKLWLEYISKSKEVFKKYGVKSIGAWMVPTEHLYVSVLEIPNLETIGKLGMEPLVSAFGAYETYEFKLANSLEEIGQMLQQIK